MKGSENKIISIQILRGIAAFLIVFAHTLHDVSKNTNDSWLVNYHNLQNFGYVGLDLFFVISGFIMILIHGKDFQKRKAARIFIAKRVIRIVPLYWLFTLIAASLLLALPEFFSKGKTFDFEHLMASLVFFPWYNSLGQVFPVLAVGWTLNVEMYFYTVFAFTLILPKKYFLISISFVLTAGVLIFNSVDTNFPYFLMIAKPILLEFLIGVYIGWLYVKKVKIKKPILWLLLSLFIIFSNVFLYFDEIYRVVFKGIPSAILIYSLLSLEYEYGCKYCNKFLIILGNASYSVYISHVFFYKTGIKIFAKLQPDLIILCSIFLSLLGGIIIYYAIEKPMYIYMKKKYTSYLQPP